MGAAAIGGATTSGIGLAAGVGWKQALGEGFLAATIFGAIGTIAESYKSAHDPGPINVPTPTPNNDKPMQQEPGGGGRAPQGDPFPDQSSHKSFEDAAPSGNAFNYMNILPSMMSDRSGNGSFVGNTYASLFGDNSYNGAKSDPYANMYTKTGRLVTKSFVIGPLQVDMYFTKTLQRGNSNTEYIVDLSNSSPLSTVTKGKFYDVSASMDGSITYGWNHLSAGSTADGRHIRDVSIPTGSDSSAGITIYYDPTNYRNNMRYLNSVFEGSIIKSFPVFPQLLPGTPIPIIP